MYLLKRSKTCTSCGCWTSYWLLIDYLLTTYWYICPWGVLLHVSQFIPFCSSRGARPPVMTLPNKASHWRGSEVWSTSCTCNMNMDMVIKLCLVGVSLGFLFQAVVSQWKGTSSVMTLALDASVFVKVCNLWWVSDRVPQGRGLAPEQLLSRITPAFRTECRIYIFNQ